MLRCDRAAPGSGARSRFWAVGRKRVNRMQLNIHSDNTASKRVAEKSGFTYEGMMRGCWFHQGEYHDLEAWSRLRGEG